MNRKYNNTETKKSPLRRLGVSWGRLVGLLFLFLSFAASAQPLPPTTPDGNPVPAEKFILVLLFALFTFGMKKIKQKNKIQ